MGIRDKPTAPASPWQNGFAERLIGSIRRECVDHMIVLGEAHLRRILKSHLPQGHRLHSGRSPDLCDAERRRESHARAVHPLAERRAAGARARPGVRIVSALTRTAHATRQDFVRGRATDVGDRPRPGRLAEAAAGRRALRGPGADGRHRDFRIAIANAGCRHRSPARRAERSPRLRDQQLLLRHRKRPGHQAWRAGRCAGRRCNPAKTISVKGYDMTTQTAEQAREGAGKKAAQAEAPKWPEQIFQKLREANISQMVYVPDAGHAKLIELCHQANDIKTTVLTTEEEGIGVLAGAWLGGERGVLLIQSSGVGNCINTLSLAKVCGFPLVLIVTMRGQWGETNP